MLKLTPLVPDATIDHRSSEYNIEHHTFQPL